MSLSRRSLFFWPRARIDPTIAAVIADPVHSGGVVNHGCVVNVVDVGNVHIAYRTVVIELSVLPPATLVALSEISVAVTDPAVKTYLLSPVAIVENVVIAAPTPVGWSPEQTAFRNHHPCTRHPVVIVVSVSPVPGCPEITLTGTKRLLVDGEFRRSE
jgi:hypothetical protein